MLAKKNRLNLSNQENVEIFSKENSRTLSSAYFLSYFRKNKFGFRVTCISPRGVLIKASKRNYYRRLMYSFLEEKIEERDFFVNSNLDLVIVLKRNFRENNDELKKDFFSLLSKLERIIKDKNEGTIL